MLVKKKIRWPLGGKFELPTWFITGRLRRSNEGGEEKRFANAGTWDRKNYCALVLIDVENAFNSAPVRSSRMGGRPETEEERRNTEPGSAQRPDKNC
jgi:hypothetical protein